MTSWKDLEKQPNKWEQAGYEFVNIDNIIGFPFFVDDYQLFESVNYGQGVRILLSDDHGEKKYTSTYGNVIVKGFKENPEKVTQLIKEKVPIKFIFATSMTGKKYITFD